MSLDITEYKRQYRLEHLELFLRRERAQHAKHKDKRNTYSRAYHKKHRERDLETYLLRKYGITRARFDDLLNTQDHKCPICGCLLILDGPNTKNKFQVDHDHSCCPSETSCGKCIRGVLCGSCNRGLGLFQDSSVTLGNALRYLSQYTTN